MDVRTGLAVKGGVVSVSDDNSTQVVSIDPEDKISTSLSIESSATGAIASGDNNLVTGDAVYDAIDALTAADVGAVPTTRTVNSKALSSDITLNGADIALTGYSKPSSTSAVAATDTVNQAIGKLEKSIDSIPTGNFVTLDTAQTITGSKTFNIINSKDNTHNVADTRSNDEWTWTGLEIFDAVRRTGYIRQYYTPSNNTVTDIRSEDANSGAGIQIFSSGYVTAPTRAYNSANTNDVVTIGTMKANAVTIADAQIITGLKTIKRGYENKLGISDSRADQTNTSQSEIWSSVLFTDANDLRMHQISSYAKNAERRLRFYNFKANGTSLSEFDLVTNVSNNTSWMTGPFRTSASDITDNDVLTAGNGVTRGTDQTITGQKSFTSRILSSMGNQDLNFVTFGSVKRDATISSWTRIAQLQFYDKWEENYSSKDTGYLQHAMTLQNNVKHTYIDLGVYNSSGSNTHLRVAIDDNNNSYATAPTRTYNASNTGDVVTIGTLNTAISMAGTKTLTDGFYGVQKGGSVTKTYTTGADTNRVVLARVNNYTGNASCRIRVEVSGSNGIKTMYIDAVWAGRGHTLTIESVYDVNNCFRYVFCVVPNNTSYYTSNPPEIHLQQVSAVARTVKATILESSGDVVLMDNLTTVGNTTNRNTRTYDVNNTVGLFDGTGFVQNAGWTNGGWDTIDNDRFKYGEAVVAGSICAIGSDGLMWKLRNTAKEFRLPLVGGRSTGAFAVNANYGRVSWSRRGIALTELTNATMQGTAFTVPTWAVGNTIYARGSLSNGNFKPDGTLSNTMASGYTWVPIGKVEKINNDSVSYFSVFMMNCSAYTLNSSGVLTHIDGKQIYPSAVDNTTTIGSLMNLSSYTNSTNLVTRNVIAYWDGRYQTSSNRSNLQYCNLGKFGNVVTHANSEFVHTSGDESISGTKTFDSKIMGSADKVDGEHGTNVETAWANNLYNSIHQNDDASSSSSEMHILAGTFMRSGSESRTTVTFTGTGGGSGSSGGYANHAFSSTPVVVVCPLTSNGSAPSNAWNILEYNVVSGKNISTSGFTINCDAGDSTIEDWMYIAIGKW